MNLHFFIILHFEVTTYCVSYIYAAHKNNYTLLKTDRQQNNVLLQRTNLPRIRRVIFFVLLKLRFTHIFFFQKYVLKIVFFVYLLLN